MAVFFFWPDSVKRTGEAGSFTRGTALHVIPRGPRAPAGRAQPYFWNVPSEVFRLLSFAKFMTKSQAMGS